MKVFIKRKFNLPDIVFDYAVIGAGLIGSAAAKYISETNPNTVLIGPSEPKDKGSHNGVFGSHYDEGRIAVSYTHQTLPTIYSV